MAIESVSKNCLFGTGIPQHWLQCGSVESIAPHMLGQETSIREGATSTS